ncbi:uncharacterized protein Mb2253c isoform X4 [Glycine max]|uniref:uncharacterized protein Mb2253c isoform X4 n=1 Tax=Glycine max TaxID=3847 RepID=UPI0007191669|nr:uncharacterized protein Mb2253c isoform X4 [Glycine max]|eukprot:XP_014620808.1 uncharacterized protein LOC100796237 isoform X4 [Glycine max]
MAEEKDAFYVVRKGDVVGIYKSFSDIQPLLASSDPYSSGGRAFNVSSSSRNLQGAIQFDTGLAGSFSYPPNSLRNHTLGGSQAEWSSCLSCTLHFDGASKGNPGPAGAGAILHDGSKVYRLREGVGIQTNNVAEYRSLILGLKHALKKGYKHIIVQGDSLLVCNQIQGLWKIKNQNMGTLCAEAKELKDKFLSFKISHIPREYNSEADAQANLAINLRACEVQEDCQLL